MPGAAYRQKKTAVFIVSHRNNNTDFNDVDIYRLRARWVHRRNGAERFIAIQALRLHTIACRDAKRKKNNFGNSDLSRAQRRCCRHLVCIVWCHLYLFPPIIHVICSLIDNNNNSPCHLGRRVGGVRWIERRRASKANRTARSRCVVLLN